MSGDPFSSGSGGNSSGSTGMGAGGAVSDIFAAIGQYGQYLGDRAEASTYGEMATLAKKNAAFSKEGTAIQMMQSNRAMITAEGTTTADIAGANFQQSGTALDLLRSNASQGAMTTAVVQQKGVQQTEQYTAQAQAYDAMAAAAKRAGTFALISGVGDVLSGGIAAAAPIAAAL